MKRSSCVRGVLLLDDGVADVRPVEAADELVRVFELQPLDDVGAGQRVGGGGQRDARHARVALVQHGQRPVLGPEVVAPLAHAVGFVDREQAQGALLVQVIEQAQKARRVQPLGRDIQQRDGAGLQAQLHVLGGVPVERGVQEGGRHAGLVERADLVVHQRDQRRDHDGHAMAGALAGDGRNLVAKALAAPGGHQHQRVAAGGDMVNDAGLRPAEGRVAEDLAQDGRRGEVESYQKRSC
jgi:hypothetical protein